MSNRDSLLDAFIDGVAEAGKDEKETRDAARVVAILSMLIPLILTFMGYVYYAAVINVAVFGLAIIKLNIPKKTFGITSWRTRLLDFFWFTPVYGYLVVQHSILQNPTAFAEFMIQLYDNLAGYSTGEVGLIQYLVSAAIVYGWSSMIIAAFASLLILVFWQYNRALRGTGVTAGTAIIVYLGLTSFVIFLGLGGSTLLNYVIVVILLRDLIISQKSVRAAAKGVSKAKDSMWLHLLKAAQSPRVAAYSVQMLFWGLVSGVMLAFFDYSNANFILYLPIVLVIYIMLIFFVIRDPPGYISSTIFSLLITLLLAVGIVFSPLGILSDILQSFWDAMGLYNQTINPEYVSVNVLALWQQQANQLGISIHQLSFTMFAHLILTAFCGLPLVYGCALATDSVELEKFSQTDAVISWGFVAASIQLEPLLWIVAASFSGTLKPQIFPLTQNILLLHTTAAISVIVFIALPYVLEVRSTIRRGGYPSFMGSAKYIFAILLVFILAIALQIFSNLLFFIQLALFDTIVLIFGVAGIAFLGTVVVIWMPLAFHSARSSPFQKVCAFCNSTIHTRGKYCPECGEDLSKSP
jgi:hypothetical protein